MDTLDTFSWGMFIVICFAARITATNLNQFDIKTVGVNLHEGS